MSTKQLLRLCAILSFGVLGICIIAQIAGDTLQPISAGAWCITTGLACLLLADREPK